MVRSSTQDSGASPRPEIVIADYGMGNVASIANMVRRVGATSILTAEPEKVAASRFLILPGVGAFDAGMSALQYRGIASAVDEAVRRGARVLGICLGFQLLFEESEEGRRPGLSLIKGRVRRFRQKDPSMRIPHMGWNIVKPTRTSRLFVPGDEELRYYFVHSYHAECSEPCDVVAMCDYRGEFCCAIERGTLLGVQFHPEKSHRFGVALFRRFVDA